jgi:very-short-patch-repair endonuclease
MANEIARSLRKRMTPQKVKLWVHLRAWRKQGFHFRRQAPRADYIVDFVCLKQCLIVEIDGGQHMAMPDVTRSATTILSAKASAYCVSGTMKLIAI